MKSEKLRERIKKYVSEDCENVDLLNKFQLKELDRMDNYVESVNKEGYRITKFTENKGNYGVSDNSEKGGMAFIL